ncbi:MAG: aminotransferase class I/II-fold pyridoxal phosphate-dependent enzyme [Armatimonadota bacterium]|nr:MAG: aminotransferase class I/II-fold pyridoxal phosphate-dependent enzyme [Armatimonadota bacterium]
MPDAISLSIGEPDFVTPWHIREAAIYSLERGHTHYTPNRGTRELRVEISRYLSRRFGLEYDPDTEILVTTGVSEGLDLACRTLLDPGDVMVFAEPCYVAYRPCAALADGVPVGIPTTIEQGFKLTPEQLRGAATGATVLLLGYPSNPTGVALDGKEMAALAKAVADLGLTVIADELYAELRYDGAPISFAAVPGMRERTLLLSGFSKALAMTGWRLGYACGPAEMIDGMTRIHAYTALCASVMAQRAATEAMRRAEREVTEMREEYNRRRRVVLARLKKIGLDCFEPQGAFYAFPSVASTGMTAQEFAERLLLEEKVAVVPGDAFGECGAGHIRICYATSMALLEEALDRMARFVGK